MASPVKLYQKEMNDNLGFFSTWLPGDSIEIGDVGVLEGGRFRRMASLKELNIPFEISTGKGLQNVQYTSRAGTKIATTAAVVSSGIAKAEITVDFSKEGAFVFHVSHLQPQHLANRVTVSHELVKAYTKGKWRKEWLFVEALHTADYATIIISQDSTSGVVLAVSAKEPLTSISLADPKVGLSVTSTRGKIMHIIGGKGLHPLYSCLRLKDPLFGDPSMQPVQGTDMSSNELPLLKPAVNELLNS